MRGWSCERNGATRGFRNRLWFIEQYDDGRRAIPAPAAEDSGGRRIGEGGNHVDDDRAAGAQQSAGSRRARARTVILLVASFALVLLALAAGGYFAAQALSASPEDALTDMASSAVKGDFVAVAASIDTTSLVDSAVDDIMSDSEARRSTLVSKYLETRSDTNGELIKLQARNTLDEEIREHVRSGTLPKRIPLGNSSVKELVAEALARKSIRSVSVKGNVAHVVATVPFRGRTLTVKVRMRRSGETWKVERIENLADVLKQAGN